MGSRRLTRLSECSSRNTVLDLKSFSSGVSRPLDCSEIFLRPHRVHLVRLFRDHSCDPNPIDGKLHVYLCRCIACNGGGLDVSIAQQLLPCCTNDADDTVKLAHARRGVMRKSLGMTMKVLDHIGDKLGGKKNIGHTTRDTGKYKDVESVASTNPSRRIRLNGLWSTGSTD